MRTITFDGKNSFDAFGLRISSERSGAPGLAGQRTSTETIPRRAGDIVQPAGLESAPLVYCFVISGSGRADCEAKMRTVQMWLTGCKGDLLDSDFPGLKYTGVCMTEPPEIEWVSRNFRHAYMTVHLTADPIMQEISAVNERVLKFAAAGTVTLTVTNNSSYTITAGGSTSEPVSFIVAEPYKYRLVCCAENPETITLNGTEIAADTIFTMPANAEIVIAASGYKYVELWHDTGTGVRL